MASFNKVILCGNLTRDPELRYTPKGTAVCKIGLAVNRVWTSESGEKNEDVTFVDVDVFGRTAENVGQYCRKGRPVLVEGRLRLDQWDDKQTGQKKQKLGVVAELVQFLGWKADAGSDGPERSSRATKAPEQPHQPGVVTTADVAALAGDGPPEQDDVPF